jgi:outer membrane protein assembly factor BamB
MLSRVLLAGAALLTPACATRVHSPPALFPMLQVWTTPLDAPAEAPLATDGDLLFVAGQDGSLRALQLTDGTSRWRLDARPGMLAARPGLLVSRRADGTVTALDPRSGATRWTVETGIAGTLPPVFDGDRLVVAGAGVAVLRADTGAAVWSQPGPPAVTAPPTPAGPCLLIAEEGGTLRCRESGTGNSVWTWAAGGPLLAAPVVDGEGRVMVGTTARAFVALRLENGSRKWRWKLGADVQRSAALLEDRVVFAAHDAVVYALARGNGNLRWRSNLPSRPLAPPLLLGRGVIVACYGSRPSENLVLGFDGITGARLGELRTPGELQGPPLLAGDRLVMALRDLRVVALQIAAPADPEPSPAAAAPVPPQP